MFGGFQNLFHRCEFERAICIAAHKPEVEFATAQILKHQERAKVEVENALRELQDRHNETGNMLFEQLVTNLKMAGLYPKDFNDQTDTLTIMSGVIFHTRRKE